MQGIEATGTLNQPMHLSKHHGLGNDFLIHLDADGVVAPTAAQVRALCGRRRGVGADGFICAVPSGEGVTAAMSLWNADGGRAEMSGNGLRCLVHALVRAGWSDGAGVVVTDAGPRRFWVDRRDGLTAEIGVEMGTPREVPVPPEVRAALPGAHAVVGIDVGNPHVVAVVDDLDALDPAQIGPRVEALAAGGTNVHVAALDPTADPAGPARVQMRTWERGVGPTEACGTGAVAVATAMAGLGLVPAEVTVAMPGGVVRVRGGDPAVLSGPVTLIAELCVPT